MPVEPLKLTYKVKPKTFRYLMDDGSLIDVVSAHDANSDERAWVLAQAKRSRKVEDIRASEPKILGVVELKGVSDDGGTA